MFTPGPLILTSVWQKLIETPDQQWGDLLEADTAGREDWRAPARRGDYPTPAHEIHDTEARAVWFGGYTRTYLERDLRDLSVVPSLVDFRRLMRAASLWIGNLVNQTGWVTTSALPSRPCIATWTCWRSPINSCTCPPIP